MTDQISNDTLETKLAHHEARAAHYSDLADETGGSIEGRVAELFDIHELCVDAIMAAFSSTGDDVLNEALAACNDADLAEKATINTDFDHHCEWVVRHHDNAIEYADAEL